MDNLNSLKEVWLTANVHDLPKAGEMLKIIKRHRFSQVIRGLVLITVSILLAAIMTYVVFFYHSNLLITRIGEACLFIAIFILAGINTNALRRIPRWKDFTNNEYINYLKEEQLRHIYFYKKILGTGFVMASVGLLLYLFEMVYQNLLVMALVYIAAVVWILANWFIIRSNAVRRNSKKLTGTIAKLERLSNQLSKN